MEIRSVRPQSALQSFETTWKYLAASPSALSRCGPPDLASQVQIRQCLSRLVAETRWHQLPTGLLAIWVGLLRSAVRDDPAVRTATSDGDRCPCRSRWLRRTASAHQLRSRGLPAGRLSQDRVVSERSCRDQSVFVLFLSQSECCVVAKSMSPQRSRREGQKRSHWIT